MDRFRKFALRFLSIYYLFKKDKNRQFNLPIQKQLQCWRKGFLPESYVIYSLENKSTELYLSDFNRLGKAPWINKKFGVILNEKLIFSKIFSNYPRVEQPIFCCLDGVFQTLENKKVISFDEIKDYLPKGEYVIKPSSGGGGFGISFLEINDNITLDGQIVSYSKLINRIVNTKNALVYKRVRQTGFANKVYPNSLNTIRILTMIDPETREVFIAQAVFRCGTMRSGNVDNWSNGGMSANIELETGQMSKAVSFPKSGKLEWFSRHPDSNSQIEGVLIPNWNFIKKGILELASAISYIPYIGWDVVPMEDDFLILEANSNSDVNLLQVHTPLLKDNRVRNFYKEHKVIS